MKRAFLIHGWTGSPEEAWWPWLRSAIENRGFIVFAPEMPNTNHPKMDAWVSHLTKLVGTPDKDCYFVCHSLGCITILRYIETLKKNQKVGGIILIAGFTDDLGYKEMNTFFTKPIDWNKIKSLCNKFVAIHSDNDPYVPLKHGDIFKEKLGAELIIMHNMRHFTGSTNIFELPIALTSFLKLQK